MTQSTTPFSPNPPPVPPAPPDKPGEGASRVPAILRTFESDAEILIKTARPSELFSAPPRHHDFGGQSFPAERRRVFLKILAAIIVLVTGASFSIPFLVRRFLPVSPAERQSTPPVEHGAMPSEIALLFAAEKTRTIAIGTQDRARFPLTIQELAAGVEPPGTITRLMLSLTDGPQKRPANALDFLDLAGMSPPESLRFSLQNPVMPFLLYDESGGAFGVALKTRDVERTLRDFLLWEKTLPRQFDLFLSMPPDEDIIRKQFEDRTYRNIDWRFLPADSGTDEGIGYAIFPATGIILLTAHARAMEKAIDRLFEIR